MRAVRSKWSRSNRVAVGASRPMAASKIRRCSILISRGGAEIELDCYLGTAPDHAGAVTFQPDPRL